MSLTLKVPPLLLAAILALLMWLVSRRTPALSVPDLVGRVAVLVTSISGLILIGGGVRSFRKNKTTMSPLSPSSASYLATGGVYGWTRNPMYVGLLLWLIAWALCLSNGFSLVLSFVFVPWMNRFQIAPEEKALEALFGGEYLAYKDRVPRWLW